MKGLVIKPVYRTQADHDKVDESALLEIGFVKGLISNKGINDNSKVLAKKINSISEGKDAIDFLHDLDIEASCILLNEFDDQDVDLVDELDDYIDEIEE